jgi:type IV pilus assembly protein PilC
MVSRQNLRLSSRSSTPVAPKPSGWGANPLHAFWRLSAGRLAMYLEQLGEMLDAGITMYEAMGQLATYAHDGRLRRMSREIAFGASQGQSFHEQLARYPQLIPPHVRGMLLVGERAGSLPRMCQQMAEELRQQQASRWKTALLEVWFGGIFVVALLASGAYKLIRIDASADLPAWQRPDWAAYGNHLSHFVLPILLGLFVAWNLVKLIGAIPVLAAPVQRFLLWLPGSRQLIRRAAMIRFMTSLDALLTAGVDIREALGLAGEATGNVVFERQICGISEKIRTGGSLQQALATAGAIPQDIKDSLAIAERAGTYQRSLTALVKQYEQGRTRAMWMTHFGVYGIMLLISAAVVVYAAATGYTGYFNALFKIFDEQ